MTRKKDLDFFPLNITKPLKRSVKKYDKINIKTNVARPLKPITDAQGLDIAYKTPSGNFIYGDTLYLSGTRNARDIYDDITKVPTLMTNRSQKYRDSEQLLNSSAGGGIKHIVSHSLAGRVAQTLKNNYPERDFKVTTYASPDVSINNTSDVTRYRNIGDPISSLDRSAKLIGSSLNPFTAHSYSNSPYTSGDTGKWIIGDTSKDTPLTSKSIFLTPPIEQADLKE